MVLQWSTHLLTIDTPKTITNATEARPMTITATAQGGRKSSDWGSGGGGESSVDTTVTTSLFYIASSYTRHSELTNEVAEGRVNPQVSKHILRVSLFGFYVNDIFQILSGDFAA